MKTLILSLLLAVAVPAAFAQPHPERRAHQRHPRTAPAALSAARAAPLRIAPGVAAASGFTPTSYQREYLSYQGADTTTFRLIDDAIYEYDAGYLTRITRRAPVEDNGQTQMQNQYQEQFTYDNGQISAIVGTWWSSGEASYSEKELYLRDAQGRITERVYLDFENGVWENSYSDRIARDAQDRVESLTERNWNGQFWYDDGRYRYTYDAQGRPASVIEESWDYDHWTPEDRSDFAYENGALVITDFDYESGSWRPRYRDTYPGGLPPHLLTLEGLLDPEPCDLYGLDESFCQTRTSVRDEYLHYVNERWSSGLWRYQEMLHTIIQNGHEHYVYEQYENGIWKPTERYTYTYDGDRILSYIEESSRFDGSLYLNAVVHNKHDAFGNVTERETTSYGQQYDSQTGTYVSYKDGKIRETLTWTRAVDTAGEPAETLAETGFTLVGPNPARGEARISYRQRSAGAARLQVYDLLGRHVATLANGEEAAGPHTVRFDTSGLAGGLYFVRLQVDGTVHTHSLSVVPL